MEHKGVKVGTLATSLTEQYLGQIDKLVSSNANLCGDSNFNINTVLFEEHYLSMFGEMQELNDDSGFYSITCQDEEEEEYPGQILSSAVIKVSPISPEVKPSQAQAVESRGSLTSPLSDNYLKWKHPMVPFPKSDHPKFKTPKTAGQSPFW